MTSAGGMPRPNPIKFACSTEASDHLHLVAFDDEVHVEIWSAGGGLEIHVLPPDVEMLHAWLGDWLREQDGEGGEDHAWCRRMREVFAEAGVPLVPHEQPSVQDVYLVPHEVSRTQDVPAPTLVERAAAAAMERKGLAAKVDDMDDRYSRLFKAVADAFDLVDARVAELRADVDKIVQHRPMAASARAGLDREIAAALREDDDKDE